MSFNSGTPVALHNSVMDSNEGCASICDTSGKLLFYTNGLEIYNRAHQVMLNGSNLKGNASSAQGAIIVPHPGNDYLFYVFCTDALEDNFQNGYTYSIVDMRGDNGKGEVTDKNIVFNASCTERMTAARKADGASVWLIVNDNNSNIFRAYTIDCNGFNSVSPVVSTVGETLNASILQNSGMLKISPDGKQLCQTHFPYSDVAGSPANFFQLFEFDNLTGIISNPKKVTLGSANISTCEYSPNSQILYLTRPDDNYVEQVFCKLPDATAISASRFSIPTPGASYYGIQLAPDGKIYLSCLGNYLGAIKNPDVKGLNCSYVRDYFDVTEGISGTAYAGLPAYINDLSFDGSNNFKYTITDSCTGLVQFSGFTTAPGALIWNWDFGDGNTSTLQNPVHSFSSNASTYKVRLTIVSASGCGLPIVRTKLVFPRGVSVTADFNYKIVCDSGYVRFTSTSSWLPDTALVQYNWDFGDGNTSTLASPLHNYGPGSYNAKLTLKTTTPCLDRTKTVSIAMQSIVMNVSPNVVIDKGQSASLNVTGNASNYFWSPRLGLSNPAISNPVAKPSRSTMYYVTGTIPGGCSKKDSVFVKIRPVPGIHVPSGFTPNNDGKNDLLRATLGEEFVLNEFSIFNRWGQKVYTSSDAEAGWNGKVNGSLQDGGVYVWIIIASNTVTGKKEEAKGSFVLIR